MTKNASFRNVYRVTVKGITTNGTAAESIDLALRAAVEAMGGHKSQVDVSLEVESTSGDYNAREQVTPKSKLVNRRGEPYEAPKIEPQITPNTMPPRNGAF